MLFLIEYRISEDGWIVTLPYTTISNSIEDAEKDFLHWYHDIDVLGYDIYETSLILSK